MKTKFSGILTLFLAFVVQITFAQDKTVSGVVSDDNGIPLTSATVLVVGTSNGTSTDFDGNYSIKTKVGDKLQFSYVGYSNKQVTVGSANTINMTLAPDNALDEVVITAFGSKKRDQLTSAVTTLSSDDIAKLSPTTSIDNMLQGVAPGVQVVAQNGKPGQTAFVRIRGIGSINASSAPLYVIDGVIAPDLSSVNPNEIENMSILKDAATASLYGSRAANGVVIIKTKSGGKNREARVTVNSRVGFGQRLEDNFEMMDAAQKIQYERELSALGVPNATSLPGANLSTQAEYNSLIARDTDWREELLKNSFMQNNSISVDGGTEKASYFFSLGHDRATGIIANLDGFERLSGRLNATMQAKDWLTVSTNVSVSTTTSDEPRDRNNVQNPFRAMYDYNPYETVYILDADNNLVLDAEGNPQYNRTSAGFSVAEAIVNNTEVENYTYIIGGLTAVAQLSDNWTNTFKIGAANTAYRRESFLKPGSILDQIVGDPNNPGTKTDNGSNELDLTVTNLLSYNKTFAEKHNVTVTGLFEFNKRVFRNYSLTSEGFANDYQSVQAVATIPTGASTNLFERALLSYGGFLDYDYEGKYLATASIRRDGSSTFGLNNRYGTFWSGSLAWNLSKESFLADNDYIDDLKLRVSAGTSGNSNGLASYASQAVIDFGALNGQGTATPSDNGNADLGFEKNYIWGIGAEFTAFDRRVRGVVDYYHRTTSDLLLDANLPRLGGEPDGSIFSNIGEMVNKGFEVELSADIIKGKDVGDFNLTIGGNIAFVDNEVTKLVATAASPEGEDILIENSIISVGEEVFTYNLVRWAGVNPANGEPLFFDADGNVTNQYNASDATALSGKSILADFDGGVNIFMTYKGFDLSADFYYKSGNYIENFMESNMLSDGTGVDDNQRVDAFNYWRNPGDTNVLPSPLYGVTAQQSSDRFLQKGDYIRLRNLTLGYKLPSEFARQMHLKSLRFYVQGQNLWTYAPYFNGDPEVGIGSGETTNDVGFGNYNLYSYPAQQSVQLGVELQF